MIVQVVLGLVEHQRLAAVRQQECQHGGRALPGDLIYVPIDADRGEFWARLRDITSTLFSGVAAAASIKVLSE